MASVLWLFTCMSKCGQSRALDSVLAVRSHYSPIGPPLKPSSEGTRRGWGVGFYAEALARDNSLIRQLPLSLLPSHVPKSWLLRPAVSFATGAVRRDPHFPIMRGPVAHIKNTDSRGQSRPIHSKSGVVQGTTFSAPCDVHGDRWVPDWRTRPMLPETLLVFI